MDNPINRIEHKIAWLIVTIAVAGLVFIGYRVLGSDVKDSIPVSVGAKTFYADLAVTDLERKRGLGGTASLDHSAALLMVFDKEDKWRISMKDMNYPIDILWINEEQKVVNIVRGAQPDSYPDKVYVPHKKALYVLELPEGSIKQYSISNGTSIKFDANDIANKP